MSVDTETAYEDAMKNLELLIAYHDTHRSQRNEATTRLHLINTLLFECLGWARQDAYPEEPRDNEYTDYSFFARHDA